MGERLRSFEAFWPFSVSEHLDAISRALHFLGTVLVLASLAAALLVSVLWLFTVPLVGSGFAWLGPFLFERNRPATFTHSLWSLRAAFRMFRLMLLGRMGPELERARPLSPKAS